MASPSLELTGIGSTATFDGSWAAGVAEAVAGGYAAETSVKKVGAPDIGEDIGGLLGSGFGGYVGSALAPSPNTIAGLMRRPADFRSVFGECPAAQRESRHG